MTEIAFNRDFEVEYGLVETLSPLVRRVVARNSGAFTFKGTATFIVGHGKVAVIDPGPDRPEHIEALLHALRGETIEHLVITHTHIDHSPAARAVKAATGAQTYGYGPHGADKGPSAEEGGDRDFYPETRMSEGDMIVGQGWSLQAVHTPGHTSNHLCFALPEEATLFTGDHVMGWSTSVIAPPDGDMDDYLVSLDKLLLRDDALYRPTHGPAIADPHPFVRSFIAHRNERTQAILARLGAGDRTIPELVDAIYIGLHPGLEAAAGRSVLAHLNALVKSGRVTREGEAEAIYRRA
jgi:glyoxylase-like metal-dependent hydrolase (beta-lactamase superfamily II)